MAKKRRFRIFYEDCKGIKHYTTNDWMSFKYSPHIEYAKKFSPYSQVAKFVREQPEHIGAVLHCEEIV